MDDSQLVLWPDGAPGAKGQGDAHCPSLTIFAPKDVAPSGSSVIICPGGGYESLDIPTAEAAAAWLNSIGIHAFVLKYRLAPHYRYPAPLNDIHRAIKVVRGQATELGIGRDRIGVLGFSSGGHLAACAGTHYERSNPEAEDPIERWSSRPDALLLIYPVISMQEFCHLESRNNLMSMAPAPDTDADSILDELLDKMGMSGDDKFDLFAEEKEEEKEEVADMDEALLDELSAQKQVTFQTPPSFLIHTFNDPEVPCENTILFAEALRKKGVPVETHLYEEGPHGFALGQSHPHLSTWPYLAARWLQLRGFVGELKEPE